MQRRNWDSLTLPRLTRETPTVDEILDIFAEISSHTDREIAIISASLLDSALAGLLNSRFVELIPKEYEEIFDGTGALSTFSAKIRLSYALGLITKNMQNDLEGINKIRNAFAHAPLRGVSFDTNAISMRCHAFSIIDDQSFHKEICILWPGVEKEDYDTDQTGTWVVFPDGTGLFVNLLDDNTARSLYLNSAKLCWLAAYSSSLTQSDPSPPTSQQSPPAPPGP